MIQSPSTLTEQKLDSMDIAKPQANGYPLSSAVAADVIKTQAAMLGHDSFRPDVYRVSEGLLT